MKFYGLKNIYNLYKYILFENIVMLLSYFFKYYI